MQLTSKEINRNNRVSLGVTIFSFMVLLVFLFFKNIMSPNSSLVSTAPGGLNIAMENPSPNNFENGSKNAGFLGEKKEENSRKKEVTDEDINAFNDAASQLLAIYKTNTIKNESTSNPEVADKSTGTVQNENGGTADGSQISFELGKRQLISQPEFNGGTSEEGKVIVEIVVDKEGTVIEANPNGRGTTTSSPLLKAKAKRMAVASKFSPAPGTEEQRGFITINFSFK